MKIERIELKNFRQYFGEQQFKFSTDPNRNVTIIHGVNGAGKTSLFVALNWCLYGEGVDNIGELVSKEAMARANPNSDITAEVNILFSHDGVRYTAIRQLSCRKQEDGSIRKSSNEKDFKLYRHKEAGKNETIDNPIGIINSILPSNARTYFFFDGEKIDNFSRPESSREVQEAIFQVLSLEVLTRAKAHLNEAAQDTRTELKKIVSGELRELLDDETRFANEENDIHEDQQRLKDEIARIEQHIEQVSSELRNLEEAQSLQKVHDELSKQIRQSEQTYNHTVGNIQSIANQSYLWMANDAIQKASNLLEAKRQRGEIPSNIRQQFINDLLERQICICGRPFSEHDNAWSHLSNLLSESIPPKLEDDLITTSGQLSNLLERIPVERQQLNGEMKYMTQLSDDIKRAFNQRDDVERQLSGSSQEKIAKLSQSRKAYEDDLLKMRVKYQLNEQRLVDITKQRKELEKKIESAKKNGYRQRLLVEKKRLAQESSDAINDMYEQFAEQKRLEVEEQTRRIFGLLAWKGDHFSDVRLSEDYKLEVFDRYGMQARPELSAGERQVLSLSFISAMAYVAQNEAPIVMDTPFGRLSSQHRASITANLPELASQLILFVTDEELRDQALQNLVHRIGSEYRLNFDKDTSCTTIEEVKRG
jgi:DNA sulfur modification protein DndD